MIWGSNDEVNEYASQYGITILNIACAREASQNKKLPTNALLVHYLDLEKDGEHLVDTYDIVMGAKVDVFDCYYDKLGKNKLKAIGFCGGTISPQQFDSKSYLKSGK